MSVTKRAALKKTFFRTAAPLLCVLLLTAAGCRAEEPVPRESLLYVNGWAVSEEEMSLLGGDVDKAIRRKVLQQLAEEYGVAEAFSYEEMLLQMEEENQRRAEQAEAGEVIYGLLEYAPLQYYNVLMDSYERSIKDQWIAAVTEGELEAYYAANLEDYRQIGEIEADATIRSDGKVVSQQAVSLNSSTYRTLSEQNETLVAVLENMEEGDECGWTDEYGLEWTLVCTGRSEDTYQAFDDVKGAVSEQWASAKLAEELSARIADSSVEDLR